MKLSKIFAGLAIVAVLSIFGMSAAHAQYEPGTTTTTPDSSTTAPGQQLGDDDGRTPGGPGGVDGTGTGTATGAGRVVVTGTSRSGSLARTGTNVWPLVGIGAAAVVLGGAFVYGSRRPARS